MKGGVRVRGRRPRSAKARNPRCTGHGRRGGVYGDLAAVSGLGCLNRAIGLIFFRAKHGYCCRAGRTDWGLCEDFRCEWGRFSLIGVRVIVAE